MIPPSVARKLAESKRLAAKALELEAEAYELLASSEKSDDEYVTRSTAPCSGRQWDAGKKLRNVVRDGVRTADVEVNNADGFEVVRRGREWCAKRADVIAWMERQNVAADEERERLARGGIRLVG